MATSIGKLQIDLIANLDKFIAGMKTATKSIDEWARKTAARVAEISKHMEKGLKELGEKMTKYVTLPLAALAAAAIKAADPTGAFAKELKTLGVEALLALEPLGKVLIDVIRQAEPTIRKGIGYVHALMESFERLNPETKKTVVMWAAIAAAIGPAAIALAGAVAVLNVMVPAIITTVQWGWKLAALSAPFFKVALAIGAMATSAYLAFTAGRQLYDNFQSIQRVMESMRYGAMQTFIDIRHQISLTWEKAEGWFDIMAEGLNPLSNWNTLPGGDDERAKAQMQIWRDYMEASQAAAAVHASTMEAINADFAANPERRSFAAIIAEDIAAMSSASKEAGPDLDSLSARAKAWAEISPEMAKNWETMAQKINEAAKDVKDSTDGTKLEETFGVRVQRRIEGFASSVGDSFADLALDGENSFKQLAKSFERMLVSMFATQLMFQPLFDAIGGYAGKKIGNTSWGGGGGAGATVGGPVGGAYLPGAASNGFRMGGAGTTVNVIDQRKGGSPVEVTERSGPDGRSVDVVIRDSVKKLLRNGDLDKDMRVAYGASRTGRV